MTLAMKTPETSPLAGWRDKALQAALFAFGVFLPFSSAGVSLTLAALVLLALCAAPSIWSCRAWRQPTVGIGLLLLAYIAIHTLLVTGATPQGLSAINKFHELLMLPLLLALFALVSRREVFIWGLTVGALGYAAAHWIGPLVPGLARALDPRRISAGFVLAVLSFVLFDHARTASRPLPWRLAAFALAATTLFRIEGRTGHLVLLVLAVVAAWTYSPRRWRVVAAALVPALVVAFAWVSPAVQKRAGETWTVMLSARPDGETSTGMRIALTASGFGIARENLPFGVGYARYAQEQQRYVQRTYTNDPAWKDAVGRAWVNIPNPHDEYLNQAACGGLIGLLLFVAWLIAPLARRRRLQPVSALLPGVVIAFAVGCLVNSLLMDFTEGHFYTALLAWLLAREATALRA